MTARRNLYILILGICPIALSIYMYISNVSLKDEIFELQKDYIKLHSACIAKVEICNHDLINAKASVQYAASTSTDSIKYFEKIFEKVSGYTSVDIKTLSTQLQEVISHMQKHAESSSSTIDTSLILCSHIMEEYRHLYTCISDVPSASDLDVQIEN